MIPQILDTHAELFAKVEAESLDIIVMYRAITNKIQGKDYGCRIRSQQHVHTTVKGHQFVGTQYVIEAVSPSGRVLFKARGKSLVDTYKAFTIKQSKYDNLQE